MADLLEAHVGEANGDDDEEEEKGDAAPPPAAQLQISLAELPPRDPAVVARAADDRIGFWNLHFTELGSTTAADAPLSSRKADREVRVVHLRRNPLDVMISGVKHGSSMCLPGTHPNPAWREKTVPGVSAVWQPPPPLQPEPPPA